MGLDFFSSFDYSLGQGLIISIFLFWLGGMLAPLFMIGFGPYWHATCREGALLDVVSKTMLEAMKGKPISRMGGPLQLILSLWITLFSMTFASLLPFCHPLTQHLTITWSLAFPFWAATFLSCFNANWQGFLARSMVAESYIASFLLQSLEMLTIFVRWLTLCCRMTMSMTMSLLLYKVFVSFAVLGLSSFSLTGYIGAFLCLSFLVIYYIVEWAIGFLQTIIFVGLLILYSDESVGSMKEEVVLKD